MAFFDKQTFQQGCQLATVGALPAPSATNQGQLWILRGGAGVADLLYFCIKNVAGGYEWKVVNDATTRELVDRTIYVATTGLDTNDGLTPGTPLLTIAAARSKILPTISADITIKLAAGTYSELISDDRDFISDAVTTKASLLFEGDFADFIPATGPATGTFDVSFGTPTIPNTASVAGATWTVDDLKSKFVELTSGPQVGYRLPVANNTAATLDMGGPADRTSSGGFDLRGQTFKFVEPSVILLHPLTVTTAMVVTSGRSNKVPSGLNTSIKPRGAYGFYGITFRATTARGLIQAFNYCRVESCSFDQADLTTLATATSLLSGQAAVRMTTFNSFFGAAAAPSTQISHISAGSGVTGGTWSGSFTITDGGFTGLLAGIGASASPSSILIQGFRSTGFTLTGGRSSQTGGMVIRNAPTAFAGLLFGSTPNSSAFLFTSQPTIGATRIYNVSVGLAVSGQSSSSESAVRNMIIDACATGVWIGGPTSQFVFQNSQITNCTGFGVRVGPGFTAGADPFYSGFSFAPGGLTMSGNVSGDLSFDGITAYTQAAVSALPDKTLVNSRGNYFVGN